jgi:hypothetical protein
MGVAAAMIPCTADEPVRPTASPTIRTDTLRELDSSRMKAIVPDSRDLLKSLNISTVDLKTRDIALMKDARHVALSPQTVSELASGKAVLIEKIPLTAETARLPLELKNQSNFQDVTRLPIRMTQIEDGRVVKQYSPFAKDRTGLLFDGDRQAFVGEIGVVLVNDSDPLDQSTLSPPVALLVSAPGAMDIEPGQVELNRFLQWKQVSLWVPQVEGDSFPVEITAGRVADQPQLNLAVHRPQVLLSPASRQIVGWGIGSTPVQVHITGMENPEGYVLGLSISAGEGWLDQSTVRIDAQGQGRVDIHSGMGSGVTLTVANPLFQAKALDITYRAPWSFLLAALTGGVVGAFLRQRGRAFTARALLIGAASGLVMTLAYAVGMNWLRLIGWDLALDKTGPAVVFVLGAVGSLAGVQVLVPKQETSAEPEN